MGGLVDGRRYFVNVDATDPNAMRVQLFETRRDAMAGTNVIDLDGAVASGTAHQVVKVVDAYHVRPDAVPPAYVIDPVAAINSDQETIDLSSTAVENGEAVVYRNGGGASIGGLVDDTVYYVFQQPFTGRTMLFDGEHIVDLDASVATGTEHRFERVLVDAPAEDNVPDIRVGAAAAIAVGVGRPVAEARIGASATLVADDVIVTASMDFDADADAGALAVGGVLGVGVAAAGNYSEGSHIAEVGAGASVTADTLSLTASGVGDVPFDLDANAASAAAGLGGNVAGSLAVNALRNHTAVRIGTDATVTVDGRLDLLANLRRDGGNFVDAGRARSDAFAGEVAFGGLAAAGASVAGTLTLAGDLSEASIGEGALVTAPDGVNVRAKTLHDFDNLAVGGSISAVFAAAAGAAFNDTNSEARAQVNGSVESDAGDLVVVATTDVVYDPDALGLAAGGLIAIAGSAEGNVINNTTRAGIGGSGSINAVAVRISASDSSELGTDTGALAASTVGAAGASRGLWAARGSAPAELSRHAGSGRARGERAADGAVRRLRGAHGDIVDRGQPRRATPREVSRRRARSRQRRRAPSHARRADDSRESVPARSRVVRRTAALFQRASVAFVRVHRSVRRADLAGAAARRGAPRRALRARARARSRRRRRAGTEPGAHRSAVP